MDIEDFFFTPWLPCLDLLAVDEDEVRLFDAEGEDLLYTLKPFMVDRLSRPVADVRVVVEEGPSRPTYVRVYAGRRAAYFREFQDAPSGCCD